MDTEAAVKPALDEMPDAPATMPAELITPDAVIEANESGPLVDRPAAVTTPDVLRPELPTAIPTALTAPLAVNEAALTDPEVESDAAVKAPLMLASAERSRPVTLTAFTARPPKIVEVFVTSAPMYTAFDEGPRRRTPAEAPVPASRMRSPPTDDA